MKTVLVSGHFEGFHDAHLAYLRQAADYAGTGGKIICVISGDHQLMMKKGKVIIPAEERLSIIHLILSGLGVEHEVIINKWDTRNTLVAEALRYYLPDVFYRGSEKCMETMPLAEWRACEECGIHIVHAVPIVERHSSELGL